MARFFVGQRVRVVGAHVSKFLIGTETVVTELNAIGRGADNKPYIGTKVAIENLCGFPFIALDGQLEPILDQKHEACDEDFKRDLDRLLERQGVAA